MYRFSYSPSLCEIYHSFTFTRSYRSSLSIPVYIYIYYSFTYSLVPKYVISLTLTPDYFFIYTLFSPSLSYITLSFTYLPVSILRHNFLLYFSLLPLPLLCIFLTSENFHLNQSSSFTLSLHLSSLSLSLTYS